MEPQKKSPVLASTLVVIILVAAAYGIFKYVKSDSPSDAATSQQPTTTNTGNTGSTATTSTYKDGTYHAIGNYNSPGGAEQVDVTLTLRNNVITEATVLSLAVRPESKFNQGKFISGYKTLVIGQKIDDVKLTKVSGSSLTPIGFNDAVAKIKVQAKA